MPANNPNFSELLKSKSKKNKLAIDFFDMRDYELIERTLPQLDILFKSGNDDVLERLLPLSVRTGTLIVVTLGAKGSAALSRSKVYRIAAVPVSEVVDKTSCGDSYIAAFCAEWYRSENVLSAMEEGSLAASKVLSWRGGVETDLWQCCPDNIT